jgi:RNA-splicing ligase RtcB
MAWTSKFNSLISSKNKIPWDYSGFHGFADLCGAWTSQLLNSATHGAGRVMISTHAIKTLDRSLWKDKVKQKGIELSSARLDEALMVYKDINEIMCHIEVMRHQGDLVEPIAQFRPKMVRMAKGGWAED